MNTDELRRVMVEHEIDEPAPAGARIAAVQRRVTAHRRRAVLAVAAVVVAVLAVTSTALGSRHHAGPVAPRPSTSPSAAPFQAIPVPVPPALALPLPTSTATRDGLAVYLNGGVLVADATGLASRTLTVAFTARRDHVYHFYARSTAVGAHFAGTVDGQALFPPSGGDLGSVTYGPDAPASHESRLTVRVIGAPAGTVTAYVRVEVSFADYRFPPAPPIGIPPEQLLRLMSPAGVPVSGRPDRPVTIPATWAGAGLPFYVATTTPGQFVFAVGGTPVLVLTIWQGYATQYAYLGGDLFTRPPPLGTAVTVTVTPVNVSGPWAVQAGPVGFVWPDPNP